MKYRAEIDGLRALAVVPVILFHAGFELFSGGFVGVDVFFVISGYLITTILIEDLEKDRFSIFHFYERRARRILPALFFVMLACLPFAWIWLLPDQLKDFSASLIAVSLFASNILFWRESGYFEAAAEENPLLHTWSLAVEEQYYVFFPIFLFLVWRFGRNRVFWLIVAMTGGSFLLSEWGSRNMIIANFYLIPFRAWELFAGSIAAFIAQRRGVRSNDALAMLGLAAILFAIFAYDETTRFPSIYAAVPVVGVVLLILYGGKDTWAARFLSAKAFVGIGLISYSAYLWHQPLFAFARTGSIYEPAPWVFLALGVASLVLAWVSWKYVETPFRNPDRIKRAGIFKLSAAGIGAFILVGCFGYFLSDEVEDYWLSWRSPQFQQAYSLAYGRDRFSDNWRAASDGSQDDGECVFNVYNLDDESEARLLECRSRFGAGTLVLGDSHAIDLFGVVASSQDSRFIAGVTRGGCRPHDNYSYCHYNRVSEFLEANPGVFDLAVYEEGAFYLLKESDGTAGSREMFSRLGPGEPVEDIEIDEEKVRRSVEYLEQISRHVPVKWFLPRAEPHIRRKFILENGCEYPYAFRENQYQVFENLNAYIERHVASEGPERVETIDQNDVFAFDFPADFMTCEAIYWSDGDHLSAQGEEHFGKRLPDDFLVP